MAENFNRTRHRAAKSRRRCWQQAVWVLLIAILFDVLGLILNLPVGVAASTPPTVSPTITNESPAMSLPSSASTIASMNTTTAWNVTTTTTSTSTSVTLFYEPSCVCCFAIPISASGRTRMIRGILGHRTRRCLPPRPTSQPSTEGTDESVIVPTVTTAIVVTALLTVVVVHHNYTRANPFAGADVRDVAHTNNDRHHTDYEGSGMNDGYNDAVYNPTSYTESVAGSDVAQFNSSYNNPDVDQGVHSRALGSTMQYNIDMESNTSSAAIETPV